VLFEFLQRDERLHGLCTSPAATGHILSKTSRPNESIPTLVYKTLPNRMFLSGTGIGLVPSASASLAQSSHCAVVLEKCRAVQCEDWRSSMLVVFEVHSRLTGSVHHSLSRVAVPADIPASYRSGVQSDGLNTAHI
jgi:hypothetical protein